MKKIPPKAVNDGILNPEEGVLMLNCDLTDVSFQEEASGRITLLIENFTGGIEIICLNDRVWWPV